MLNIRSKIKSNSFYFKRSYANVSIKDEDVPNFKVNVKGFELPNNSNNNNNLSKLKSFKLNSSKKDIQQNNNNSNNNSNNNNNSNSNSNSNSNNDKPTPFKFKVNPIQQSPLTKILQSNSSNNKAEPFKVKLKIKSPSITESQSNNNDNDNDNDNSNSNSISDNIEIKTNKSFTFQKMTKSLNNIKIIEKRNIIPQVKEKKRIREEKEISQASLDSRPNIRDDETLISELQKKLLCKVQDNVSTMDSSKEKPIINRIEEMSEEVILQYLREKSREYRVSGEEVILKDCPFCVNVNGKADNMWKLYIHSHTGVFFCFRCACKGNWNHLRLAFGDLKVDFKRAFSKPTPKEPPPPPLKSMYEHIKDLPKEEFERLDQYSKQLDSFPNVLKKLTGRDKGERGIKKEVLEYYKVGATSAKFKVMKWEDYECVTFPWTTIVEDDSSELNNKVVTYRCKLRAIEHKLNQRLDPAGKKWGFFGWHTIPKDAKQIIITEGEYDAMAVYQETGLPTISLPNGFANFPSVLLPLFDRFEKIILWMDDDTMGRVGAINFSELLGSQKTFVVYTKQGEVEGPKDANDALLMGKDFKKIINSAKLVHKYITDFSEEKQHILEQFEFFQPILDTPYENQLLSHLYKYVSPSTSSKQLNFFLGLRASVLSSQFALQNAFVNKINTLYITGDLLFKPKQFLAKMVTQHLNVIAKSNIEEFSKVPIHFSVSNQETFKELLETIAFSMSVYKTKHIVLDNIIEHQYHVAPFIKIIKRFLEDYQDVNITIVQSFLIDRPTNNQIIDDVDNYIELNEGENFDDLVFKKINYQNQSISNIGIARVLYDLDSGLYHELDFKKNEQDENQLNQIYQNFNLTSNKIKFQIKSNKQIKK